MGVVSCGISGLVVTDVGRRLIFVCVFVYYESMKRKLKCLFVYYESMKRKLKIKPIYECLCNDRLQTKRFTLLSHTFILVYYESMKRKLI